MHEIKLDGWRIQIRVEDVKLEGIVSKRLSEPYVSGRMGIWTKAKCRKEQHAVVGGWTESNKGFAGLLLGVYRGKKLIPIGPARAFRVSSSLG